jgi:hypothetical protein
MLLLHYYDDDLKKRLVDYIIILVWEANFLLHKFMVIAEEAEACIQLSESMHMYIYIVLANDDAN